MRSASVEVHSPSPSKQKYSSPQARQLLVGHHLRRPGAEVLNAPDLHARLVDVDPVVGEEVGLVDDQRDGDEIAIAQLRRRRRAERGSGSMRGDELADRRRRDDVLAP